MASLHEHKAIIIDVTCVISVGLAVLWYAVYGKPTNRGFFCDDESIRYPYLEQTVSNLLLTVLAFGIPNVLIVCVEGFRLFDTSTPRDSWRSVGIRLLRNCYEVCGVFIFGSGLSQVTVDSAKYSIGRLRPHFWAVCEPAVECSSLPSNLYITEYTCNGDPSYTEEGRLSFPSGHSALAFYAAVYAAIYLQHRMLWKGSVLFKHVLQGVLIWSAWFTALSRVFDNMHHPTDVLAGGLIGTFWALIVTTYVVNLNLQQTGEQQEELRSLRQKQVHTTQGANSV